MQIKQLKADDLAKFRDLIEIFREVFGMESSMLPDEYLAKLMSNPDFLVLVAADNDRVIGGLTIYVLHGYFDEQPTAYIYDVGIMPEFQGQGVGRLLISEVCRLCREKGFKDIYVEAESTDLSAVQFYKKTLLHTEMNAVHFSRNLNPEPDPENR